MNSFPTTLNNIHTTEYYANSLQQQTAKKESINQEEALEIADAIFTNNEKKFKNSTANYTIEALAKARFDWITKSNFKYENSNLFLIACLYGNKTFAEKLLATKEVEIDECFSELKRTPLMVAATRGQTEIIDFLLKSGANWKLTDTQNYRAYQLTLGCCFKMFNIDKCMDIMKVFLRHAEETNEIPALLDKSRLFANMSSNEQLRIIYINNNQDFILLHRSYNINPTNELDDQFIRSSVDINERTGFIAAYSTDQRVNNYFSQISKLSKEDFLYILSTCTGFYSLVDKYEHLSEDYRDLRQSNKLLNNFVSLIVSKHNENNSFGQILDSMLELVKSMVDPIPPIL